MQAATELEALSRFSTVVPDTYLMQDLQRLQTPKAATVTSSVLSGILNSPAGLREYEVPLPSHQLVFQLLHTAGNACFDGLNLMCLLPGGH